MVPHKEDQDGRATNKEPSTQNSTSVTSNTANMKNNQTESTSEDPDHESEVTMSFDPVSPVDSEPASEKSHAHTPAQERAEKASEVSPNGASGDMTAKDNHSDRKGDAHDASAATAPPSSTSRQRSETLASKHKSIASVGKVSEWSHQQHMQPMPIEEPNEDDEWQDMPAYAPYDIYDDDNKLVARERVDSDDEEERHVVFSGGQGYTRVTVDEDAKSATSLDDTTAYLFKEVTNALDDDEEARNVVEQMQATKDLLTPNERIAYVGVVRLALAEMEKDLASVERTRGSKKELNISSESMKMLTQKLMIRLYSHMELESAEQLMIEQLTEHGLQPNDLTPTLMRNSRVSNPLNDDEGSLAQTAETKDEAHEVAEASPEAERIEAAKKAETPSETGKKNENITPEKSRLSSEDNSSDGASDAPPPYTEEDDSRAPQLLDSADMPLTKNIDIDLRWTVLCDLFLILVADSVYDARSRVLLERVGAFLDVPWLEICRFEKRVTDALEMQEGIEKEVWDEEEHIESRRKLARRKRLMYMGLATVGGGLVIGLSAGALAPVIGAGLAAGLTTMGVSGTGAVLGSTGAAAVIGTGGTIAGSTIGGRAASRRTGHVKTFEYRPLHNNKRVNLIVTVAGWMNGKVDDVRLPFSTVDPIMGDIYSVLWEPEMLTSMGDTINILATEALTQGLQQILGSTILMALMSALQVPLILTKLSYLIDNPWSVSMARADAAGLILADSLIDRNLGTRPITLVGFSLGSRVIMAALRELARKNAVGIIQNVYIFGSPVVVKKDEYLRARAVVAGRFVNGYATNDWILGYLFRATGGGIMRVAGLASVEVPGIENFDVTEFVPGHMAYRKAIPKVLREVGWDVTSDEFTEIEDPDPENHQARQRQLIDEIEEARKELEAQPQKKRFGLFKRNKKALEKKNWEMYDERSNREVDGSEAGASGATDSHGGVIFDVDAIQREVLELATQGIAIKQLESTLPPMKINPADMEDNRAVTPRPSPRRSNDDASGTPVRSTSSTSVPTENSRPPISVSRSYEVGPRQIESHSRSPSKESLQMTLESSSEGPDTIEEKVHRAGDHDERTDISNMHKSSDKKSSTTTHDSHEPIPTQKQNPWGEDEDDEFREKEMEMTFA